MDHIDRTRERYCQRGWGAGNQDVLWRYAADDIEDVWHGTTGVQALVSVVRDLHETFPDPTLRVRDQAAGAGRVTTVWTVQGTDVGGLLELAPTGRPVEMMAICLDDLVEGRIVHHQQVSDMFGVFRQLEVIPADWRAERLLR